MDEALSGAVDLVAGVERAEKLDGPDQRPLIHDGHARDEGVAGVDGHLGNFKQVVVGHVRRGEAVVDVDVVHVSVLEGSVRVEGCGVQARYFYFFLPCGLLGGFWWLVRLIARGVRIEWIWQWNKTEEF